MGSQFSMSLYNYYSDDESVYVVGLRTDKAAPGGFTEVEAHQPLTLPRNYKMRYVLGMEPLNGNRCKLPVAEKNSVLFESATQFSYLGVTYTISARIGEKRPGKF